MTDDRDRPPSSEEMIRRAREELDREPTGPPSSESDAAPLPRPADGLEEPKPRPRRPADAIEPRSERSRPDVRIPVSVAALIVLVIAGAVVWITRDSAERDRDTYVDSVESGIAEGIEQMGLDDETASCVLASLRASGAYDELDELSDDDLITLATISPTAPLSDYPPEFRPVADALVAGMVSCIDPADLGDLGTATGDPATLGADPDLDRLWRGCESDGAQDCDLLYLVSPVGSGYESFGATCGGRNGPDDGLCSELHGDGIRLADWRSACAAGDNGACDLLYQLSPVGSDDEAFGTSCGGRDDASPLTCWARLGPGSG